MTAIEFEHVSKQYRLGLVSTRTLSHDLRRFWITNILGKEDPYLKIGETNDRATRGTSDYVWALRDINFKVEQGDVVGIIGKNGAGKSTLLKLLSRVTGPTTGTIRAHGRIGSLLEVGTGFHGEMTGRENIFMNGAILGMTRQEIQSKLDEIIDFSGCERYIDTPVKRYSSGMTVRLGFAVAAFLEPEILVVDEVLAVGDAEFQKKAIGKMKDVSHTHGRTVLFVSHNMGSIAQLCRRGMLLSQGQISYFGEVQEVISKYISDGSTERVFASPNIENDMYLKKVFLTNEQQESCSEYEFYKSIHVNFEIGCNKYIKDAALSFIVYNYNQAPLFTAHCNSFNEKHLNVEAIIPGNLLLPGIYYVKPILHVPNKFMLDICDTYLQLTIIDTGSVFTEYLSNKELGYFNMPIEWI